MKMIKITVGTKDFDVIIDEEFVDDVVPNFSGLKHYEGEARIKSVEIPTEETEDVYESDEEGLRATF
jgi:hypothetical protein